MAVPTTIGDQRRSEFGDHFVLLLERQMRLAADIFFALLHHAARLLGAQLEDVDVFVGCKCWFDRGGRRRRSLPLCESDESSDRGLMPIWLLGE